MIIIRRHFTLGKPIPKWTKIEDIAIIRVGNNMYDFVLKQKGQT